MKTYREPTKMAGELLPPERIEVWKAFLLSTEETTVPETPREYHQRKERVREIAALCAMALQYLTLKAEQDSGISSSDPRCCDHGFVDKTPADWEAAEAEIARLTRENQRYRTALQKIEKWFGEFPATGRFEGGEEMSYGYSWGSNGERDYMRKVAR